MRQSDDKGNRSRAVEITRVIKINAGSIYAPGVSLLSLSYTNWKHCGGVKVSEKLRAGIYTNRYDSINAARDWGVKPRSSAKVPASLKCCLIVSATLPVGVSFLRGKRSRNWRRQ